MKGNRKAEKGQTEGGRVSAEIHLSSISITKLRTPRESFRRQGQTKHTSLLMWRCGSTAGVL